MTPRKIPPATPAMPPTMAPCFTDRSRLQSVSGSTAKVRGPLAVPSVRPSDPTRSTLPTTRPCPGTARRTVCPCLTPGGATDRVESWAWTAVTEQSRSSAPITLRRMLDFSVDIMMKG